MNNSMAFRDVGMRCTGLGILFPPVCGIDIVLKIELASAHMERTQQHNANGHTNSIRSPAERMTFFSTTNKSIDMHSPMPLNDNVVFYVCFPFNLCVANL